MFKTYLLSILSLLFLAACFNSQDGLANKIQEAYQKNDYETAFVLMNELAETGKPEYQSILGGMYSEGVGTKVNIAKALEWESKAAEQGYGEAQYAVSSGHLVFKSDILLDPRFVGYPLLEFHNKDTGKIYKYINEYYGFFFLPDDVLPSNDYAIIQVSEQGYVEGKGIKKQFHQLDKAFLLNYKTGCLLDTGMSFASWHSLNELVNDATEDPPRNVSLFRYNEDISAYPWTDTIPAHLVGTYNDMQAKALLLKGFVSDGLGMSNQLACLPISHENITKYQHLYFELKAYKYVNEAEKVGAAINYFKRL